MQWLMPVISALWKAGQVDHLRSVRHQPGQHGETPSLQISQSWWCTLVMPATQEAEVGESQTWEVEVAVA